MAEAATTTTATTETTAATATTAAATTPWYQGKLDPELIGHAQNSGWKLDDPAALAAEAVKAHREARKFIGVPEDQIIRLPKDLSDEAGWKGVWNRLGVPKDAKEYDFSGVKTADGSEIEQAFLDKIRATAFARNIPKEAAAAFAQEMVNFEESTTKAALAEKTAALEQERASLKKSWGPHEEANRFIANQARKALQQAMGVDDATMANAINSMENALGYAAVMKLFHTVGTKIGEDRFISGTSVDGTTRAPMSKEQAKARHSELMADPAWRGRYLNGGAAERREMDAINRVITGVYEAA